jgi:hypothetical protein
LSWENILVQKSASGSNVLLWNLPPESEAGRFLVQRSADGKHFRAVGHLTVPNNASAPLRYEDEGTKGAAYYRVIRIDGQGRVGYSHIVKAGEAAPHGKTR